MRRAFLLALTAGCSIPDFVYPPGPPIIERFEVTPFELSAGRVTTIEWKVTGATSIVLHGAGDPRDLTAEGSLPLMLDRTTEFELVATGEGGTSRALAEARLLELAEVQILRFEVAPSLVEPDDPVRVVWRTEHSSRVVVRISSGETLIDHAPAAGTLVFRPQRDVTVQLVAEGWPEPKTALHTVRADPDGPMILFFTAQPTIAPIGQEIGIEWNLAATDRVRLFEATGTSSTVIYEEQPAGEGGFIAVLPGPGTHTYLLEASSAVGTVVETTTAFVLPQTPPEIVDFTVTPTITGPGGDVVVRYSTRFTDRAQLWANGMFLFVGGPSEVYLHRRVPNEILSFELVAQNALAQLETRALRTVLVSDALPAIEDLEAFPLELSGTDYFANPGDPVSVSWRARDADAISIATDVGEILHTDTDLEGEFSFVPTIDVNLVFTAENARGRTIAYLPLRVLGPPRVTSFTSNTSVARRGRPVTFNWTSESGEHAIFSFETTETVPLDGSIRQKTTFLGVSGARLEISNDRTTTATVIDIDVIERADDAIETEPNDSEALAGGPYFTFPGAVAGEVAGFDVDLFELAPPLNDRITLDTTPPGGCAVGVALEVYEVTLDLRLLGPRLVIDGPSLCASANPLTTPVLASLEPPVWIAIKRPSGTSTITVSPYQLSFSSETGVCGDGVIDLLDDCDDANFIANDGCSPSCRLEGLDEMEPNYPSPVSIPIETPVRSYLSYQDVDLFRFEIDAGEAGQRSILLESPVSGSCTLDAEVTLRDPSGSVLARDDNDGLGCAFLAGPSTILTQGVYELEVRPGRGVTLPRKGRYVFSVR